MLEMAMDGMKNYVPTSKEWLLASWPGFPSPKQLVEQVLPMWVTGIDEAILSTLARSSHPIL